MPDPISRVAQHQDGSLSRCTLRTVSSCNRMRRMRSGITTASPRRPVRPSTGRGLAVFALKPAW
jgi:hypothetical protein